MKLKLLLLYLVWNSSFAIEPKKDYIATPKDYDIDYKEIMIKEDNQEICVWVSSPNIRSKKKVTEKTIILVYGDYGNMSYYISYIKFYTELGYNVVSFDYRGFGKSSNFLIEKDMLFYNEFASDLRGVILYCKNNLHLRSIGLVSLSMGTILTAIAVQGFDINFIIAEGCVYNYLDIIDRLKKYKIKDSYVPLNSDKLPGLWKNITSKMLIFVADLDTITNLEDAQNIVLQDPYNRSFDIYNGGHLTILNSEDKLLFYKQKINHFLKND